MSFADQKPNSQHIIRIDTAGASHGHKQRNPAEIKYTIQREIVTMRDMERMKKMFEGITARMQPLDTKIKMILNEMKMVKQETNNWGKI